MAQLSRDDARARVDDTRRRVMRLLDPVALTYLAAYVVTDLLFVRRWSLGDGGLIVPLAALYVGVVVADWRGWDRSSRFRRAAVVAAALFGVAGALLTSRI